MMNVTQKLALVSADSLDRQPNFILKDDPKRIMTREYLIINQPLSVGSVSVDPLALLLANPNLTQYVAGFSYFRTGIKIRFVMVSNPVNYGFTVVAWAPEVSSGDISYDWTNKDPTILDISQQEGCELTIPYTSVYECQKLPYNTNSHQIRLIINTMISDTLDPTVPVPVLLGYASLFEPEFFGAVSQMQATRERLQMPILEDLDPLDMLANPPSNDRQIVPYQESALDVYNPRQETSSALTTFSSAVDTVATVGSLMVPEVAPILGAVSMGLDLVEWGYDFVTEMWDRYTGVPETKVDHAHEESEAVKFSTFGNVAGCIYGPALTMNSHIDSRKAPYHLTDLNFKHRILDICKIPTLRNPIKLTSSTTEVAGPAKEIVIEPLRSFAERPSYMDHWANCFRFWRGSIKVCLKFYSSPLSSATILVYSINQRGIPITGDSTVYAFKRVVNVRGTTTDSFVIPYINDQLWTPIESDSVTVNTNKLTNLYVRVEAGPSTGGATSGSIYCQPIISAGDDFQFKSLCSPIPKSGGALSQGNISHEWKTLTWENALDGPPVRLLDDLWENGLSAEEMSMRYSERTIANTVTGGLTLSSALAAQPPNLELFDFVQNSFRYVRGSYRLKVPAIPLTGNTCLAMQNNFLTRHYPPLTSLDGYLLGNGACANSSESTGGNPLFEIEVPFLYSTDWIYTPLAVPPFTSDYSTPELLSNVSSNSSQYIAAGRDYQLAHLLPPLLALKQYPAFYVPPVETLRANPRMNRT